jgi:hypothetical protein
MKQQASIAVYLTFVTLLITGILFVSGSKNHTTCPVCNHSIASEVLVKPTIATINTNK